MIILVLFLLTTNCYAGPGHYECGLHGRFEYCIDDFPGCVVGCHCYPGYYFDTDTKICEPNTKLTQDYRRHLVPTSYNLHGPSGVVVPPPSPALPNFAPADLGPAAGDTTQDHGDLSDWLYNQFFKTIESQVVNKTDDEEPLKLGTRRSGDGGIGEPRLDNLESFLARRHRGKGRKKAKRRRSRKKILRDESDSSDSSSSSDSESNSDESGNLGSWERYEWGPNRPNNPPSKEAAAQRQIVMYSKKPKPPLPSFIFLPNMQTAFYPPIGLPAPIPMYPMVPVPPITGVQAACSGEKTTADPTQGTTTPPPTTTTLAPATSSGPPSSPPPVTDPAHTTKPALRSAGMYNLPPSLRNKNQHKPSNKPLPPPPPLDFPIKQYDDFDYDPMFLGDNNFLGPEMRSHNNNDKSNFKYISDLIHKDHNVTTPNPTQKRDPKRYEQFFGMKPHENKKRQPISPGRLDANRRRFDSRQDGEDDSYYSSLGKQIAKLIRGLDSKGVREADIKIEPQENPKSGNPFFSESSYAARTYWERFVRSPLSVRLMNFTKYDDLIAGNEQLFDLENQVQDATSAPALSWDELENIINTMGTIRNQVPGRESKHNSHSNLSNSSFNVSLLPRFSKKKEVFREAKRNHALQTPNIKNADHTLNTPIRIVIRDLRRFDPTQKIVNQVVSDKPKEINEANKNTAGRILARPIHVNTKIHKFRNIKPTKTPKLVTSSTKEKKHDVTHAIGKNSDHKHNNEHKPHMIIAGQTTYVKSNKYFFDPGTNYQSENWFVE